MKNKTIILSAFFVVVLITLWSVYRHRGHFPSFKDALYLPSALNLDPLSTSDDRARYLLQKYYGTALTYNSENRLIPGSNIRSYELSYVISVVASDAFRLPNGHPFKTTYVQSFLKGLQRVKPHPNMKTLTISDGDNKGIDFHLDPSNDAQEQFILDLLGIDDTHPQITIQRNFTIRLISDQQAYMQRLHALYERMTRLRNDSPYHPRLSNITKVQMIQKKHLSILEISCRKRSYRAIAFWTFPIIPNDNHYDSDQKDALASQIPIHFFSNKQKANTYSLPLISSEPPKEAQAISLRGLQHINTIGFNLAHPKTKSLQLRRAVVQAIAGEETTFQTNQTLSVLLNTSDPQHLDLFQQIEKSVSSIGLSLRANPQNEGIYTSLLQSKSYELCIMSLPHEDQMNLYDSFHSSQIPRGKNRLCLMQKDIDMQIEDLDSIMNPKTRKRKQKMIQENIQKIIPFIVLGSAQQSMVYASGSGVEFIRTFINQ